MQKIIDSPSPFARNSISGRFVQRRGDGSVTLFWKQSQFQKAEIEGAEQASQFYPLVQRPKVAKSGELLYPFFDGKSQSEIRASYVRGGRRDIATRIFILNVE